MTAQGYNDDETDEKTVDVQEAQQYTVELSFLLLLYQKGNQNVRWTAEKTGGSVTFGLASFVVNVDANQQKTNARTDETIDFSRVKTLYFSLKCASDYNQGYPRVGISTKSQVTSPQDSDWAAAKNLSKSADFVIVPVDVSACMGNYYVTVAGLRGDSGPTTIEVQDVWGDWL